MRRAFVIQSPIVFAAVNMSAKGLRAPPYRVSPEITEADLRGGSAGAVGSGGSAGRGRLLRLQIPRAGSQDERDLFASSGPYASSDSLDGGAGGSGGISTAVTPIAGDNKAEDPWKGRTSRKASLDVG